MDLSGASLTWFGHAAIGITLANGTTIFIDPWLTNPLNPTETQEPSRVDGIYLTHGHFDHVGDTLDLVASHDAQVFAIHEIAVYLEAKGVANVVGSNKGGTVAGPGGIQATLVEASHSSGISDDPGIVAGGEAAGWVLDLPGGETIYHAGDTGLFGDMQLIGELYSPDLAILPIGGHFTMGPGHAARAARMLGVAAVLPIHYGTFPILAGTPAELSTALADSGIEVIAAEVGVPL